MNSNCRVNMRKPDVISGSQNVSRQTSKVNMTEDISRPRPRPRESDQIDEDSDFVVLEEAGFSDAFLDIRNASSNVSIDSFGDFFNQTFATPSRDDHQNQISHSISGGSGNCKPVEALLERMMDMIVALGEGRDKLHNKMDKFFNHYQQLEKVNTDLLQKIKNLEAKLCKQNPSKTLSSCSSDSDSPESNSESSDSDSNDSSSCDDVPYTTIKSRKK